MNNKKLKFIVPIFTFVLSIASLEITLSFFYPKNDNYYVFNPRETNIYSLDSEVLRGVSDTSKVVYNSFGARASEIPLGTINKIVAFGGSTTECITLDQEKTWTSLLEYHLNQNPDSSKFWIGNFGKSANHTHHHILQLREVLQYGELKDVQTAIFLLGFNDLTFSVGFKEKYLNPNISELKATAFTILPDSEFPFYKTTAIWKFAKKTKRKINLNRFYRKQISDFYINARNVRKNVKKTSVIPDLTEGLNRYRENIMELIKICKSRGIQAVFITQPVLWRPNISAEGKSISPFFQGLEFGSLGYLTIESLYTCMDIFNDTLLETCKEQSVLCVNLAPYSKEEWFYDNCHYNEHGAQEVAKIIYQTLNRQL